MTGRIKVDRAGYVATVTLDNPTKRNAVNLAMCEQLSEEMAALAQDPTLRCIVFRGEGEEAFGSGLDISEFERIRSDKATATNSMRRVHPALRALLDCPVPTLAAIRGVCVGGGLELAACCDLRIATDNSRFGIPIGKLGGALAYPELEGVVLSFGPVVALEILLEGRIFGAAEAAAKGMLTRVVPVADFEEEVRKAVDRITSMAPLSAQWHKKFVNRLRNPAPLSAAEHAEAYECFETYDFHEGSRAFLAKRAPRFEGR
ncbi:MAG: enoyl-CoA hydratase-related protein [Ottowia sp.]|uniref:enoyl-CoA hydratase-related protein n=1 Tax=Ottowia sp. TaxID=1898956 RepID=UPI0039E58B5B